jgi:TnsA endonuclease N terminal
VGKLQWNEALIERFEREGRGKGEGEHYKPWLYIGDFASRGRTHDPTGLKSNRPHQLFSDNEYHFFMLLEWCADVVDIREQFPLARKQTLDVAAEIGAPHPYYSGTHVPTVMTVDFMVTRVKDGRRYLQAFNVKSAEDAEDELSMAKLEVQRETLERQSIEHYLVFDTTMPQGKIGHVAWIRGGQLRPKEQEPYPGFFEEKLTAMAADIAVGNFAGSLAEFCIRFDSHQGLARGTGLRLARMLMGKKVLRPDLTQPSLQEASMNTFLISALPGQLRLIEGSAQ